MLRFIVIGDRVAPVMYAMEDGETHDTVRPTNDAQQLLVYSSRSCQKNVFQLVSGIHLNGTYILNHARCIGCQGHGDHVCHGQVLLSSSRIHVGAPSMLEGTSRTFGGSQDAGPSPVFCRSLRFRGLFVIESIEVY